MISWNRTRIATKARKVAANAMRKMHVPAYWPSVFGVQAYEYNGVVEDVKNTIAIESIPIIDDELDDIDIGPSDAVGIDMPDMVAVADSAAIDMLMLMLLMSSIPWYRQRDFERYSSSQRLRV
jgi:hypothetical protein